MHIAIGIVAIISTVTIVSAISARVSLPAPLVLTVVGLIASFTPGIPTIELSPDLILTCVLPPLLYGAALKTSLIDFRRNARPIALLSVGLVIANTVVVGYVVMWLLPVPAAAAFALGAIVAPPDAVAATAIAKRVGMPRRLVTILEGESLVNDATALVALRTASAAIVGASVSVWHTGFEFGVTAIGGVAVGVGTAIVTGKVRRRLTDVVLDTAISIITPFIAYMVAEALDLSGVLAVVVAGLILGHKAHLLQSASSRVFERTNWATIEFLLENTVFLLIGLQVREIIRQATHSDLSAHTIVTACIGVTLTTIIVRPVWVFPATYLPRLIPSVRARDPFPPWTYPAAISWAGMRGVVTLAAAFVLPPETPHREVLILIALSVVGVTLIVQGATLPWWLRHLGLSGPDPREDALHEASLQQRASAAGLARLDEVVTDSDQDEIVERVRKRSRERVDAMWERLGGTDETPAEAYSRLRLEMIDAERSELIRLRDDGSVPDDVLRRVIASIDVEETMLDLGASWAARSRDSNLVFTAPTPACEHLAEYTESPKPNTPEGCEECMQIGLDWVHLRLCLECGHVGCCDSSIGLHATGHYEQTQHPVMRSFELGEAWRWCYLDERLG